MESNEKSRAKIALGIALGVLGAVVAFLPITINRLYESSAGMGGMEGGHAMVMACETTVKAELAAGVAILALAVLSLIIKSKRARITISLLLFAGGLLALLFPTAWTGVCEGADMACRMITLPTLIVISVLTMAFSLIYPVSEIIRSARLSGAGSHA
jgi:hypothetical protein